MKPLFIVIILGIISICPVFSQTVSIHVQNKPLPEVLFQLRDKYQIQFTYNPKTIENCRITQSKTYSSAEEAIRNLTQICNLTYKKNGTIFILLPHPKSTHKPKISTPKPIPIYYTFAGKLTDSWSGESLPSGVIQYQNKYVTTDNDGNFSLQSTENQILAKISYLGFYQKDTILKPSKKLQIQLQPANIELEEVLVQTSSPIFKMHLGQSAGKIKLNHKITTFLAGNQDNGIYNLLRLQAGIMAAGEQNHDYTIWWFLSRTKFSPF